MMAMRREVFGIGSAQVALTVLVVSIVFLSVGVATLPAIALGGAIAVESALGAGSTFRVWLASIEEGQPAIDSDAA